MKTRLLCLWKRLGDAYRRTDDYDNAIGAHRKADALASESASPHRILCIHWEEPQIVPAEDISDQPKSPLETNSIKEGPPATEGKQTCFLSENASTPSLR